MPKKELRRKWLDPLGFSLIELMIVVAIIGSLATVALPSYTSYMHRTRVMMTVHELSKFQQMIEIHREVENKLLANLTGHYCSRCSFAVAGSSSGTWAPDAATLARYKNAGFLEIPVDPWGSYFLMDENEDEYVGSCTRDYVRSVGANRIYGGAVNDDITLHVSHYYTKPGCVNTENNISIGPDAL